MFGTRPAALAVALLFTVDSAQVAHANPLQQQANTEGRAARSKWVTFGVVTGLAGGSLISSAAFNARTGSDAGGCTFGDVTYDSGCKNQYKKESVGFLIAGLVLGGVALGIGFGWKTSKPAAKPVVNPPPKPPETPPKDQNNPEGPPVQPQPPAYPVDSQVKPPTTPSVAITPPEGNRTPGITGTAESTPPAAASTTSPPTTTAITPSGGEPDHGTTSPNPRGDRSRDKPQTTKGREARPPVPNGVAANLPIRKKCNPKILQPYINFTVSIKPDKHPRCLKLQDDAFDRRLQQGCEQGLFDEPSIREIFNEVGTEFTDEECVQRVQRVQSLFRNPK